MKKTLITLLILLAVVLAAGWLLYPVISDQVSQGRNAALMQTYDKNVREMTPEQITASFAQAEAYNAELEWNGLPDVFTQEQRTVSRQYQNALDIHNGIIGELTMDRIGVSLPVYHAGAGTSAQKQLIHVAGTSLPADQDGTHIVLAGPGIQRAGGLLGDLALTDARMLEDLDRIVPDDLMYLRVMDRTMIFRVEGVQTLAPDGLASLELAAEEGSRMLTLITQRKDRRLLIRARQVSEEEVKEKLAAEDHADIPASLVNVLCMGIPVLLIGILAIIIMERILRRKYRLPTEHRKREKTEETVIPDELKEEIENPSETERNGVSE